MYLKCVQEHKGCLLLVCSDYGTENGIIAGMQCFLHSDNAPFFGELAHSGVLESALNDMRKYWNTHYIRQSCHKTVAGVPDTLYFLPEN
ncbi:unnamed protein product, partial [Pocillopora meandrina]